MGQVLVWELMSFALKEMDRGKVGLRRILPELQIDRDKMGLPPNTDSYILPEQHIDMDKVGLRPQY